MELSSNGQGIPARPSTAASIAALLGFFLLSIAASYLGSLATTPNIAGWYSALQKPILTPPNSVFPVVWSILYAAMAVSAWLIWRADSAARWQNLAPFFIQLALNIAWSWAFFGFHSPLAGAVVIVLLIAAIGWTIHRFHGVSRLAALLLVPYLVWVAFASYLNLGILVLNG